MEEKRTELQTPKGCLSIETQVAIIWSFELNLDLNYVSVETAVALYNHSVLGKNPSFLKKFCRTCLSQFMKTGNIHFSEFRNKKKMLPEREVEDLEKTKSIFKSSLLKKIILI